MKNLVRKKLTRIDTLFNISSCCHFLQNILKIITVNILNNNEIRAPDLHFAHELDLLLGSTCSNNKCIRDDSAGDVFWGVNVLVSILQRFHERLAEKHLPGLNEGSRTLRALKVSMRDSCRILA